MYDVELFKDLQTQCAGMNAAEYKEWYAGEKEWYDEYQKETKVIMRYIHGQEKARSQAIKKRRGF